MLQNEMGGMTLQNAAGKRTLSILVNISGSLFRTQLSLGAVKPGKTVLPDTSRTRFAPSSRAASFSERTSFHRMHGRSTCPDTSSSVAPCIWPATPIPFNAANSGNCERSSATAQSSAMIQSAGSCSDQPGLGFDTPYSRWADPTGVPLSSTSSARKPEVPRSIPRKLICCLPLSHTARYLCLAPHQNTSQRGVRNKLGPKLVQRVC